MDLDMLLSEGRPFLAWLVRSQERAADIESLVDRVLEN